MSHSMILNVLASLFKQICTLLERIESLLQSRSRGHGIRLVTRSSIHQ